MQDFSLTPRHNCTKPESLRVLFTAYPLLPVTAESCGGAEQVLATLESTLAARGHWTAIAACAGSHARGHVFPTGEAAGLDQLGARQEEHNRRVVELLRQPATCDGEFDLLHDHSGGFWPYAREVDLPVLATLHLPREFYPDALFHAVPENVFFNCVSQAQRQAFADLPRVVATVRNGIPLHRFPFQERKSGYLLWMGRLCEEKGAHVAIEIARTAGMRLVIAGGIYPFSYHREYFEREIRPYVEAQACVEADARVEADACVQVEALPVEYVGVPDASRKHALLANARALLITSLVDETSSLTAMEAMACGTPVVALSRGALPEIIPNGECGLLAYDVAGMARALQQVDSIRPRDCRARVEANYSAERMADEYEALYASVLRLFQDGDRAPSPGACKEFGSAVTPLKSLPEQEVCG